MASACAIAPAAADGAWGGQLALTTDYVFRGVSQTRGDAAIQGGIDYQHLAGWFAGAWLSTIDINPGPGPTTEWNAYLGLARTLTTDWQARVSLIHYAYPDDDLSLAYDYDELVASVAFKDRLVATVSWSPNTTRYSSYGLAEDRDAFGYELIAHWPLPGRWIASGSIGYYDLDALFGTGYGYGSLGVGYALEHLQLDLAWFRTDDTARHLFGRDAAGQRWSFTAGWRF